MRCSLDVEVCRNLSLKRVTELFTASAAWKKDAKYLDDVKYLRVDDDDYPNFFFHLSLRCFVCDGLDSFLSTAKYGLINSKQLLLASHVAYSLWLVVSLLWLLHVHVSSVIFFSVLTYIANQRSCLPNISAGLRGL